MDGAMLVKPPGEILENVVQKNQKILTWPISDSDIISVQKLFASDNRIINDQKAYEQMTFYGKKIATSQITTKNKKKMISKRSFTGNNGRSKKLQKSKLSKSEQLTKNNPLTDTENTKLENNTEIQMKDIASCIQNNNSGDKDSQTDRHVKKGIIKAKGDQSSQVICEGDEETVWVQDLFKNHIQWPKSKLELVNGTERLVQDSKQNVFHFTTSHRKQ